VDALLPIPARSDSLPEHTDYTDTGCDLYPRACTARSCAAATRSLAAPRPCCATARDASILRLSDQDGMTVEELATMFGLSRRTIFRVLRRGPD
jgi:transcriptional regulator of acetoin/glycerol metabolism